MEIKKCAYCNKDIQKRKKIVKFINIEQGSPYLFCSLKCKKAWLSERIGKSQIDGEKWSLDTPIKKKLFDETGNLKTKGEKKAQCKYCDSEWKSNASKIQHERWCDKNPDKRKYRDSPKIKKPKIKSKPKQRNERIKELKTIKPYFSDVWNGVKTFEVRFNDRGFCIGDLLLLREYSIKEKKYLSREIICKVDYILDNSDYLKKGYIIMGIYIIIKNELEGF